MEQFHLFPPMLKIELHAYNQVYDVSKNIRNWNDLKFMERRQKNTAVYQEMSGEFIFVLEAYNIIDRLFREHEEKTKAQVYVYLRKNSMMNVGTEYCQQPHVFDLNFLELTKNDIEYIVPARRVDLVEIIESRGNVVFDIPVSEIRAPKMWNYDRLMMVNTIKEAILIEESPGYVRERNTAFRTIGMSNVSSEVSVKDKMLINTTPDGAIFNQNNPNDEACLIEVLDDVNIDISFNIEGTITGTTPLQGQLLYKITMIFPNATYDLTTNTLTGHPGLAGTLKINTEKVLKDIKLKKGDKVYIICS